MRITLDTNVLVSATFWHGDSSEIIKRVENKEFELILSKEILEEFASVLESKEIQDKIRSKNLRMRKTVQKIVSISTIVEPIAKLNVIKADPSYNVVLECAKEGKADFIISNDKHVLAVGTIEGIRILSPKEFLNDISDPRT